MKPRIAAITGAYGTEVQNGVGRFLCGLHRWSRERGYPLHVFSSGDHVHNYPEVENIHALSFPVPGGFQSIEAYYPLEGRRKQLERALQELDPDVVHVSTPEAVGMTGVWIARKRQRLLAGIYHTDFPAFARRMVRDGIDRMVRERGSTGLASLAFGPLWGRLRPVYEAHTRTWERWLLGFIVKRVLKRERDRIDDTVRRAADRLGEVVEAVVREVLAQFYGPFHLVLTRSEIYREKLIRELGLRANRVRTLRAGVDVRMFSPQPTSADEGLRERLGLPPAAKLVLYVGRVTDEKNAGFLADAWRAYREGGDRGGSGVVFAVAGGGNLEEFRRRAGAGVHMFGPCHGEMLSAVYRLADVFWTASTTETLGQVVLEAQASGVPTLVSDEGAARENVRDGRTGRVLPVDAAIRWAQELRELLRDGERRAAMGRAARAHAEAHTIEASYRDYWDVHEQLVEREGARSRTGARAAVRSSSPLDSEEREEGEPLGRGRPTTHLSDFHAGKRSKKIPKEAALRAACRRAAQRGAAVFLQGDFLDTRPPAHKFRKDVAVVRRTLDEFGVVPEIYVEGNHDYEFGRARQIEDLLGCPVAPSLVHYDAESGLVLTHGHVSELAGIQSALKAARGRQDLIDALSVDRLREALKLSALRYDVVGAVTDFLERGGLQGLEDVWRHSYEGRRWIADRLMEAARNRSIDDHGVRALIQMIGSSAREQVLSQLCSALGGWGLVYGHTHEPHVTKRQVADRASGAERAVLLGNCGSFRRKSIPPTWIEAAFPCMELWAYNATTDDAELMDRVSLQPEEALAYEAPPCLAPAGQSV
jgi:glycosyltransferase involved in cell wall biosynthesis/UDP-2,3-diacylglucosamine pyrophosphatase LpxH